MRPTLLAVCATALAVLPSSVADADTEPCPDFTYQAALVSWQNTLVDGVEDTTFAPEIERVRIDFNGRLVVSFRDGRNQSLTMSREDSP